MADIFDEIDEDLKRDQIQMLWARYGRIVIAGVAAIVMLVAVRQGYSAWQNSQSLASAASYQMALKSDDVTKNLEAQLDKLTNGYTMLAQFQIAAKLAANDNYEAAEVAYLGLASDPDLDPLYQQVARLLSVMVAPQDTEVASLVERLDDLEKTTGPWQAIALETGAGLALRAGDREAAVAKYERLINMAEIPGGMRQRAERMKAILSN